MKITLDKSVDAAYIYLSDSNKSHQAKNTYSCDPLQIASGIHLDFDINNQLIGIEIENASLKLPQDLLDKIEIIG